MKKRTIAALTTALTLLPIPVGLGLGHRLPQRVAIHFDYSGAANGWGSRPFVVFALPLIMLAMHAMVVLAPMREAERKGIPPRMQAFAPWVAPALSLSLNGFIYARALGIALSPNHYAAVMVGAALLLLGNYMPKSRPNRYFGVRCATTQRDPEIWRKVNRFAGWSMTICGALAVLSALLGLPAAVLQCSVSACSILLLSCYGYAAYLAKRK